MTFGRIVVCIFVICGIAEFVLADVAAAVVVTIVTANVEVIWPLDLASDRKICFKLKLTGFSYCCFGLLKLGWWISAPLAT